MTKRLVTLTRQISVTATLAQVFAAATDWSSQSAWIPFTDVKATSLDGHAVGGTIEAYTGIRPVGFLDTMVVTQWVPPSRCVMHHTGTFVRGDGVFEIVSTGDNQALFIWSESIELPFGLLGRLGWSIIKPVSSFAVGIALKRFKRHVEKVLAD